MRSLHLQASLTEFISQATARLHADVLAGQEVPFELASQTGRGRRGASPLYCYQPLTDTYVTERFPSLRGLDAYAPTAALLDAFDGLDRYLLSRGLLDARERRVGGGPGRGRCDAALLALLQEVCAEQTDFDGLIERHPERLERALESLEDSTFASFAELTLVATLHGLAISSPEIPLTRGLLIAQPDAVGNVPEQAQGEPTNGQHDRLLVVYTAEDPDPRTAISHGIEVVRELLRALRLFGDGRITLGSLAWTRIGSAPYTPMALGTGGRPHGMLLVSAEQEDELRAFCNLVSRRTPHANEIAWALRRFELGCERPSEYEGVSDHLLALRTLLGGASELEPHGSPDGLLAARLAALCATPDRRTELTQRILSAIALEREAIAGTAVQRASGVTLARDLSDHLRALLRDVVCGHLPSDLVSLADELLLSGEELPGDDVQTPEVLHVAV